MPIRPQSVILNCPAWWTPDFSTAPAWWTEKEKQKVLDIAKYLSILMPAGNPERLPGLLLWGPPGRAKTSAALFLAWEWAQAGHYVAFIDFEEFMTKWRSAWRKDAAQTTEQILEDIYKPRLLIIDDVGKRAAPENQEVSGLIVNGRINRGHETIATTNCILNSQKGQDEFKAACDSRTLERMNGADVDLTQKAENLRVKK